MRALTTLLNHLLTMQPHRHKPRNRLSNVSTTSADSGVIGHDGSHDDGQDSEPIVVNNTNYDRKVVMLKKIK